MTDAALLAALQGYAFAWRAGAVVMLVSGLVEREGVPVVRGGLASPGVFMTEQLAGSMDRP